MLRQNKWKYFFQRLDLGKIITKKKSNKIDAKKTRGSSIDIWIMIGLMVKTLFDLWSHHFKGSKKNALHSLSCRLWTIAKKIAFKSCASITYKPQPNMASYMKHLPLWRGLNIVQTINLKPSLFSMTSSPSIKSKKLWDPSHAKGNILSNPLLWRAFVEKSLHII